MPRARFEDAPYANAPDETDVNLRAHFDAIDGDKLDEADLSWSDEQLMRWDGNFRGDGFLMLVCCDRSVDVQEYRSVLAECLEYRRSLREHRPPTVRD